jgi:hypothetical protein
MLCLGLASDAARYELLSFVSPKGLRYSTNGLPQAANFMLHNNYRARRHGGLP